MALLTVRTAAQRLGVGYSTLKQWIYSGTVRTTTTAGGHHRIADAEIDRLMARGNPSSTPAKRTPAPTGLIVALSGRNRLRGFVEEVRVDGLLAQVRLRIGDQIADRRHHRRRRSGAETAPRRYALAIIKSTEVMIAREAEMPAPRRRAPARKRSG